MKRTDADFRLTRRALLACALAAAASPARANVMDRSFVTSDGVTLHYLEAGSGPTIAFVPGWCMPAWIFMPQITALSQRWRVAVMDPRGQGRSEVPAEGYEPRRRGLDIAEFLRQLQVDRVVLAGWSLGVLDSISYLSMAGDSQLAGLVLIDNSVGEGTPPTSGRGSNFFKNLRSNHRATMDGFVRGMFWTPQEEAYIQRIVDDAVRMPVESAIRLLSYQRAREFWRDTLYGTRKPVLYSVRPKFGEQARLLAEKHADATADVYEDAGHALFVDRPERFNASVNEFMQVKAQWE